MVPDRQKVWTDGGTDRMDGRMHGRRQNYIPPTLSGDNKTEYQSKEIQQVNPGGPDNSLSIRPLPAHQ